MDNKELKKMLAGFAIASLLAGANLTSYACSSCSGSTSCDGQKTEGAKTSCSGEKTEGAKTSCSGATACSGEKTEGAKTSCSGEKTEDSKISGEEGK